MRVDKFKYLGGWIQPNGLDKVADNKGKVNQLETAYRITRISYKKRNISFRAKTKQHNGVIKPEGLYASECLTLSTERGIL